MIVCLWSKDWDAARRESLTSQLLAEAPRLAFGQETIWADARGLDAESLARRLVELAATASANVRAGVATLPIVAELAARTTSDGETRCIEPGEERAFLAACPLTLLALDDALRLLLQGVGIETCGELAALEREAVEVRFGPELLVVWQQSRAEDPRRLFSFQTLEPPHASIDFIDYEVTDPERLIFSANSLFGNLCAALRMDGLHARRMTLSLSLANGEKWERVLRPARPTSSRTVWLRLARAVLERITVSAAVIGIALSVSGTETASAVQGDLFDAGFATASAVDGAIERLIEAQGELVVEFETSDHPLAEQRSTIDPAKQDTLLPNHEAAALLQSRVEGLALHLLAEPREVLVETVRRRDHQVPVRYRDQQWRQLLTVAGPDRISGGRWDEPFAREYFRGVTVEGTLVWIYRDARNGNWFLHGWWD